MTAHRIAIYGKGGIGKSTIATSLSVLFAQSGLKVLHVGCDPKQDSSLKLMTGKPPPSLLDALTQQGARLRAEHMIGHGRHGVEFIEAGGPEPGVGCAGRGVSLMIERLDDLRVVESGAYDVVLYDVLGDVVCGGFAAPLRRGIARQIYVVTSEEPMSLFAANNIVKAVVRFANNGVVLGGLIGNVRSVDSSRDILRAFADKLGTRVVATLGRDNAVRYAEYQFKTVVETAPSSPASLALRDLAASIQASWQQANDSTAPRPLSAEGFVAFVREHFAAEIPSEGA